MDKKIVLYLKRLLNGIFFYVGWFLCVFSAAADTPLYAFLTTAVIMIVHFALYDQRLKDLILLISMVIAGFLLDTFYILAGWLSYHSPDAWIPWGAPLWILCIHAIFAITINHSLSWLKSRPYTSAVLGAGGVALTYLAGERMGAVDFLLHPYLVVGLIALIWFFYVPALYWYSVWLDHQFANGVCDKK